MCQKRRERHKQIKKELVHKHGSFCMCCENEVPLAEITMHHIRPKYLDGADSYDNCLLLCKHCHFEVVNKLNHESEEYTALMNKCKSIKRKTRKYDLSF